MVNDWVTVRHIYSLQEVMYIEQVQLISVIE